MKEGLPQDRYGFRLRGLDMTRVETFTDAAFAFAVTLLVISTDSVPGSYSALTDALLGVPAFAFAFALIMSFWWGHWSWSRRFGLEDGSSIVLSSLLVFLVLVFVYPLKYLASLMSYFFSNGRLSPEANLETAGEIFSIFTIYGIGYVAMTLLIAALNIHALRVRDPLELDELEIVITYAEIRSWLILAGVGTLSVVLALFGPRNQIVLPGWVYMLLPILMPLNGRYGNRQIREARARTRPTGEHRDR
jgi:uncharacterized membrane protein